MLGHKQIHAELTNRTMVLIVKAIIVKWWIHFPLFMKLEHLLLCSQIPVTEHLLLCSQIPVTYKSQKVIQSNNNQQHLYKNATDCKYQRHKNEENKNHNTTKILQSNQKLLTFRIKPEDDPRRSKHVVKLLLL